MKLHDDVVVAFACHELRAIDALHEFRFVNHHARGVILWQNIAILDIVPIQQTRNQTGMLDVHADVRLCECEFHIRFRFVHHARNLHHGFSGDDDVALRHRGFERHGTFGKLERIGCDNRDLFAEFHQNAGEDRFAVVLRGCKYGGVDHVAAIGMIHLDGEGVARKTHLGKLFRRLDALQAALGSAAGDFKRLAGERHFRNRFGQLAHDFGKQLARDNRKAFLLDGSGQEAFFLQHQIRTLELNALCRRL